jgi:hypothetical protein
VLILPGEPAGGSQPASTSWVNLYVFGADATTAVGPSTYTVADPTSSIAPTGAFAVVWFAHEDSSCNLTAAPGTYASAGSVTITSENLAGSVGAFTATFGEYGSLSGSFTAPPCGISPDAGVSSFDAGTICPAGATPVALDAGCLVADGGEDSGSSCASFLNIDTSQCNPLYQTGCGSTQECAINTSQTATCVAAPSSDAGDAAAGAGQGQTSNVQSDCIGGTECVNNVCETYCCTNADCISFGAGHSCAQATSGSTGRYGVCH